MNRKNSEIKNITIDQLAGMMLSSFRNIEDKMATKEDLKEGLDGVEIRLGIRIDRIENLLLTDHRNRIDRLEDKVLRLETSGKK